MARRAAERFERLGPVVVIAHVFRGLVVQLLLTVRSLGQLVAEGVAVALRVERPVVEVDHLLLGAADEVPQPGVGRELLEGVEGGEGVRQQQAPQVVVGVVLAHVRSGRQQQQVLGGPGELPSVLVVGLGAGQGLGQPVAARLAHPEVRLTVR